MTERTADRRRFERFIAIDWSASSTPKRGRDSIWVATAASDGAGGWPTELENPPTRADALAVLEPLVVDGRRTLITIDTSLGYPAGTAQALGLAGLPHASMWQLLVDLIDDQAGNTNNRFAVAAELNRRIGGGATPFWGVPPRQRTEWLATRKPAPPVGLAEWREVEARLRQDGLRPFSCWQLLGAGAVGSQSLLAIPALAGLIETAHASGRRCEVWPFTTGLAAPPDAADVVIAEMWPSLLTPRPHEVRDAGQVLAAVDWLIESAASVEGFANLFDPVGLDPPQREAVVAEEGWVLGVGASR